MIRNPRTSLALAAAVLAATLLMGAVLARPMAPVPAAPALSTSPASLWQDLESIIGGERGEWSVLAVSLDRGDTLFAHRPDRLLAPASNIKLLTTAAALEYLGPDYRYMTFVAADGPIRDGVLEGNLYLYGTGDPTLGTRFAGMPAPPLRALADSLTALGVREIRGDIVGDGSYFSGPGTGEGWPEDDLNAWYAAQAGALSVHENLVGVEVSPAPAGGPAELTFEPGGEGVAVRNEAGSGGDGRIRVVREEYGGPIVVSGGSGGDGTTHAVLVSDPAMYAAALFRDVLEQAEVILRGEVAATDHGAPSPIAGRKVFAPALEEGGPALQVLAVHRSEPLQEILTKINHQSHNFYAEQVLRTIGRVAGGDGSAGSGARAITQLLERAGVDTDGIRIVDGGGLSPLNRVSAAGFIALLAHMAESPHAERFLETLPVAGETRRFRRMGGTPAGGNLQAKTGTIDDVSALSGYVTAANGERIAFSIIGNALPSEGRAKDVENQIGVRLAAFQRGGQPAPEARAEPEA